NRRHDGAYRWFVTRAVPIKDEGGAIVSWCGVTTDIHDQKEAAEQLRQAGRRKDEFLATLAHELRGPLAPICAAVQFLRLKAPPDPDLQAARDIIDRQARQMGRLVDDLQEVSRVSRGKVQLRKERVDLAAVVQSAIETARPLIAEAGHELHLVLLDEPIL